MPSLVFLDLEVAVHKKKKQKEKGIFYSSNSIFSFSFLCLCVCLCAEGQPDPDPRGEGDQGGVGPVPAALRPLHALHPGGAGSVRHVLLRAPALPPPHEGEAGQPGD